MSDQGLKNRTMMTDVGGLVRDIRAAVAMAEVGEQGKADLKQKVIGRFAEDILRIERNGELRVTLEQIPAKIGKAIAEGRKDAEIYSFSWTGQFLRGETPYGWSGSEAMPYKLDPTSHASIIWHTCEQAGLRLRSEVVGPLHWRIVVTDFRV